MESTVFKVFPFNALKYHIKILISHIFKMTACRLATLALLTLLASCLHQHNTLIDYNETEYLQGLQQAESQLRSDLSKIKAQV